MDRQTITEHHSRPAQVQNRPKHAPKRLTHTTHSWKQKIVGSCLAILGLGSSAMAYGQEDMSSLDATFATTEATQEKRLCNRGYIEHKKQIYEVSAKHCKTGMTGNKAVNKDDIVYRKVSSLPIGSRVMKILDREQIESGELDKKEVTIDLRVYNIEGETGKNRYHKQFTGIARYDTTREMYYVEVPKWVISWYSEHVSEFYQYKMKSSSGSPVEWQGKFA